jgi:hypothetical protein
MGTSDIVPVMIAALAERDGVMIDCRFHRVVVRPVLQAFLFAYMTSPSISLKHLASRNACNVVPAELSAPLAIRSLFSLLNLSLFPLCFYQALVAHLASRHAACNAQAPALEARNLTL